MKELISIRKPWESQILTFKISMILTGFIVILLVIVGLVSSFFGYRISIWFTILVFLGLGFANYQCLRQLLSGGDDGGHSEIRNAWGKESDWWKK